MAQASAAITTVYAERRKRPVWAVVALTFATFNIYFFFWFGATWAELKRERNDDTMHPLWHALTLVVPFYGLFRVHAHFRTLNELLETVGLKRRVSPGGAVLSVIGAAILARISNLPIGSVAVLVVLILSCGLLSLLLAQGQRALNEYYGVLPVPAIPENLKWFEWVLVALGVVLWLLVVLGTIARA